MGFLKKYQNKKIWLSLGFFLLGCKQRNAASLSLSSYALYNQQDITLPKSIDIQFSCPVQNANSVTLPDSNSYFSNLLNEIAPPSQLKLSVIQIFRSPSGISTRHLSNETSDHLIPNWSLTSTSFMSFAFLGSKLRAERDGQIGLESAIYNGVNENKITFGQLITDASAHLQKNESVSKFSSRAISTWVQDMVGREKATQILQSLIKNESESFAGGYGEAAADLKNTIKSFSGNTFSSFLPSNKGEVPSVLSTGTMAEIMKKLALFRELPEERIPSLQWGDVQTILYGNSANRLFASTEIGGMMRGPLGFITHPVEQFFDTDIAKATDGRWRVFAQYGSGPGNQQSYPVDVSVVGYACLPVSQAFSSKSSGTEFVFAAVLRGDSFRYLNEADALLANIMGSVTTSLLSQPSRETGN